MAGRLRPRRAVGWRFPAVPVPVGGGRRGGGREAVGWKAWRKERSKERSLMKLSTH